MTKEHSDFWYRRTVTQTRTCGSSKVVVQSNDLSWK